MIKFELQIFDIINEFDFQFRKNSPEVWQLYYFALSLFECWKNWLNLNLKLAILRPIIIDLTLDFKINKYKFWSFETNETDFKIFEIFVFFTANYQLAE